MIKAFVVLSLAVAGIVGGAYLWKSFNDAPPEQSQEAPGMEQEQSPVVFPIEEYAQRRTVNAFGEEGQVTLEGFHVADDIEYTDADAQVPVFAIADGIVQRGDWVRGYGGVMVIKHDIEEKTYTAIYGHLDQGSIQIADGEEVSRGQQVAYLGEGETEETDGERTHLHFALYEGTEQRIQGYEPSPENLENWLNPHDFFAFYGLDTQSPARVYNPQEDLGGSDFALEFAIPEGWEVEYDDTAHLISLFELSGEGPARERAQVTFTYFDAESFLTLSTVTIHEVADTQVGQQNYTAKQYDIEKKQGVSAFQRQPSWRQQRHTAIDLRGKEGRTRYYSVAKNPELDQAVFQSIVDSITIMR